VPDGTASCPPDDLPGTAFTRTHTAVPPALPQLLFDDTTWDLLPGVENAVLLAAGTLDPVVQLANSRVMVERLQNPWLVTFSGAHAFFLQHMPAFLQVLDTFLSEI
jgi:pimeloyl-ACP methyl ester carboxylesterase